MIKKTLSTPAGSIIISVLLGLGLAAMFKTACKDGKCIVIEGPKKEETDKFYYKINDDCYKYTTVATKCAK